MLKVLTKNEKISISFVATATVSVMLGSSWRFSRQLPTWSRKVFSLCAVRAGARNVSSLVGCSQRAAPAVAADQVEGQQAAMGAGQPVEAARPFSDIPGENISP